MSTRIQIVFFHAATDTFSGGAKMLHRLLTRLDKDRFEPILLTQAEDELTKRVADKQIRVEIVPMKGVMKQYDERMLELPLHRKATLAGRMLQYNVDTYPVLKEADVIWCENIRNIITLLPFRVRSKTPFIWNVGLGQQPTGVLKYLQLIAFRAADQIFIESEEQARRVFSNRYEANGDKFTIFSKGIDTEKFSRRQVEDSTKGIQSDIESPAIGTAATITPRKGLDDLIHAFRIVHNQNPDVDLYIAGDTSNDIHRSYKARLHNIVGEFGLTDSVHFLGWVDDMPAYLAALDVFVLTSHNEGISGAVREAMAMELPVVSSDVGGMSDLIAHDETGLLVTPGDVNQISKSIIYILSTDDTQNKFGENGRDVIMNHYSLSAYVNNYEKFLENIS